MRITPIPHTDLAPSALCLGSGDFGAGVSRESAFALLDAFYERGGNFVDTAKIYNDWIPGEASRSEKVIGAWLRERGLRDRVIVATKGAHPELHSMQIPRVSPAEITADLEASLRHLAVERVDLYYLHRDDITRPVEEIIDTLEGQARAGKLRYYAASNWSAPRLKAAQDYAAAQGKAGFAAVQNLWNLAQVDMNALGDPTLVVMDETLWQYHNQNNLAAVPFTAQAGGLFQKLAGSRRDKISPGQAKMLLTPETERRFTRLQTLQAETGLSVTQIVLGYLMAQPFATIPVIGPHSMEHLLDSLTAADCPLTWEQAQFLTA